MGVFRDLAFLKRLSANAPAATALRKKVDFTIGMLTWAGESFRFPPLSRVPQELVVAGGIENLVRRSLAQA